MKKILGAILVFVALLVSSVMVTYEAINLCVKPVFADEMTNDDTSIIKCDSFEGKDGVMCILNIVLTILTYGIGILGVIGIMISGIQYITSSGDPAKMTKAKNRIVQIVIGLILYAVMWAALRFLVPGFEINT